MQSGSSRRCLTTAAKQSTAFTSATLARGNATKASAAAAVASSPASTKEHPLFDLRRMKARSNWKPKPNPDSDGEIFPNERLGNTYDLNWASCSYGVIPNHELFRNLHVRGLQMFTNSKIDEQKAVHVSLGDKEGEWQQLYVAPPPPPSPPQALPAAAGQPAPAAAPTPLPLFSPQPNAQAVNAAHYKQLFKEVRKALSNSPHIFMHDGAVGSHKLYEEVSRFFTSNPDVALFLRHVIPAATINGAPKDFGESVVAFVAPELKLSNPGEVGLKGNNFSVVDFAQNRIIVGGTRSLDALQQAIASLTTYRLAHKGVLPLSGSSILGADGKPIVVFGSLNLEKNELFGSFGHLWSSVGVSRLFNGAVTPYAQGKASRGDLVWTAQGKTSLVAPLGRSVVPSVGHPSKLVFVTEGKKTELNKLSNDKAAERYTASFSNFPVYLANAVLKERFEQALKEHNVPVFELSVAKDKEAEAKALLLKN